VVATRQHGRAAHQGGISGLGAGSRPGSSGGGREGQGGMRLRIKGREDVGAHRRREVEGEVGTGSATWSGAVPI
jgi:hypothetical protein